jgi:hypothetical protein
LPIFILCPEVANRGTLEEEETKVHRAENQDDGKGGVDDDLLISFDGESEEVGGDREFGYCCRDNVEEFANKDDLQTSTTVSDWKRCRPTLNPVTLKPSSMFTICAPSP